MVPDPSDVRHSRGAEARGEGPEGGGCGPREGVDDESSDGSAVKRQRLVRLRLPFPRRLAFRRSTTHPTFPHRPATLSAIAKLFSEPQHLSSSQSGSSSDPTASEGFTLIDLEEQNAGYQVSYSRLAASESAPVDPVAYAGDVSVYVKNRLSTVGNLVGQAASQDAGIAALASGLGL